MWCIVQVLVAGHGVYGGNIAIFMPQFSSSIFTMAATLLVVQDALDNMGECRSTSPSFTASTTVGYAFISRRGRYNYLLCTGCKVLSGTFGSYEFTG
jgi:hypothetical protein